MKTRTILVCIIISVVIIFSFVNYCTREQAKGAELKIGGHTTQLGASLMIAEAKGFYLKHGLNTTIRLVESSKQSMAAMEAGDLDVVIGSLSAGSFNMIHKGDLVIIADGSRVIPSIVIRKDLWLGGEINRLEDLKGRTIRTPRIGSSSYYALSRILRGINLTIDEVNLKYLSENGALAALEARQIDAVILNEPHATNAVKKDLGIRIDLREIEDLFPAHGQQHMVIYTRRKTLEEKPEMLKQFLRAYLEAAQFYEKARNGKQPERSEAIRIITEYTGSDPAIVEASVWPYISTDGIPNIAYIREMHDYFLQQELVEQPIDLDEVIDLELLQEAGK